MSSNTTKAGHQAPEAIAADKLSNSAAMEDWSIQPGAGLRQPAITARGMTSREALDVPPESEIERGCVAARERVHPRDQHQGGSQSAQRA